MSYRPIATFSYTRKLKAVTPGRVRQFRLNGKKVKAVSPDGYKLQIIDAPASLVPRIRTIQARGEKLSPYKDQLRIIRPKKRKSDGARAKKPKPKPKSPRMKAPKPKKTVQTTMPVHAEEKPEEEEREAEDLKEEEEKVEPEIIIIGKGAYGLLKIAESVEKLLSDRGIQLVARKTKEACEIHNSLVKKGKKIVAALHITC